MSRLFPALALLLLGCGGGDPKILSVALSPSTIAAGGTVNVTVQTENIDLHAIGLRAAGLRAAHGDEEGETAGHLHAYLDTTNENPLTQTSSASFPIVIPAGTIAGAHEVIVRFHNGDHTIYTPEVKSSASLTVQ